MTLQRFVKHAITYCALVPVLGALPLESAGQTKSFHIGNSLTSDGEPGALNAFAQMRGKQHSTGYHVRGASSLTKNWNIPSDSAVFTDAVYGNYTSALPDNAWDAVTLQPHNGQDLDTEIQSALEYINLAQLNPENADTVFYIYEAWPGRVVATYEEQWNSPLPLQDPNNLPFVRSRSVFDLFYERLTAETDATIKTIPVGEVLYQFDVAAKQGQIPGFESVYDLYRDHVHLTQEVGRYIASVTTFATVLDESPIGLTKPPGAFLDGAYPLTPGFYREVHRIIRNVLNADPDSGVYFPYSDANGDGIVDLDDLAILENSYPGPQFDVDGDGMVGALDFLNWQRSYKTEPLEFDDSPGNLNGTGLVDGEDLALWTDAYQNHNGGDVDGDGDSDGIDFLALQREFTPYAKADVNRDLRVDGADLEYWYASYGYSGLIDFNDDGESNELDFLLWQSESEMFTQASTTTIFVPEPDSQIVGIVGLLTVCLAPSHLGCRRSVNA